MKDVETGAARTSTPARFDDDSLFRGCVHGVGTVVETNVCNRLLNQHATVTFV